MLSFCLILLQCTGHFARETDHVNSIRLVFYANPRLGRQIAMRRRKDAVARFDDEHASQFDRVYNKKHGKRTIFSNFGSKNESITVIEEKIDEIYRILLTNTDMRHCGRLMAVCDRLHVLFDMVRDRQDMHENVFSLLAEYVGACEWIVKHIDDAKDVEKWCREILEVVDSLIDELRN